MLNCFKQWGKTKPCRYEGNVEFIFYLICVVLFIQFIFQYYLIVWN